MGVRTRVAIGFLALAAGLGTAVALAGSGGLDPSFGTGGATVLTDRPTSTDPEAATLSAGGKIVAVTSVGGKVYVTRLLPSGAPDPSFDGDGTAVIQTGTGVHAGAIAVEPDGRIVVTGTREDGITGRDMMVWRLKANGGPGPANGALDPTFDTDGIAQFDTGNEDAGGPVAIDPSGRIVVAGATTVASTERVSVYRVLPDGGSGATNGALDTTFDVDGVAGISDGTDDDPQAVALQPDGKILVAGQTHLGATGDAVVWRLKADGGDGTLNHALDPTFDTDGQADFDETRDEHASGIALLPDGRFLLAGATVSVGGDEAIIWRVKANGGTGLTNGALDPTFDADGRALFNAGGSAVGDDLTLQPDGKILLVGAGEPVGVSTFEAAVWRVLPDGGAGPVNGAMDPTFGVGGLALRPGTSGGQLNDVGVLPDRRIVGMGNDGLSLMALRVLGDPYRVTVVKAGEGTGAVSSSTAGIDCGLTCTAGFDDATQVFLGAAPVGASVFTGWSGAGCSGTAACGLTMTSDQTVTATFAAVPPPRRRPSTSS